jgi:hypothetical protein
MYLSDHPAFPILIIFNYCSMEQDIKIKREKQREIGIALTCTPANRYNYDLYEQVTTQGAPGKHGRFSIYGKTSASGRNACQQGKKTV